MIGLTGKDIARRRRAVGMSQTALARMVGMTNVAISRVERGIHSPAPQHAWRIEVILSAYERGQREAFELSAS
jgi:transcriptional regulator with XRE-family HTH domain